MNPKGRGYFWPQLSQVISRLFLAFNAGTEGPPDLSWTREAEGPQLEAPGAGEPLLEAGFLRGKWGPCEEGGARGVDGPRALGSIRELGTFSPSFKSVNLLCIHFMFDLTFACGRDCENKQIFPRCEDFSPLYHYPGMFMFLPLFFGCNEWFTLIVFHRFIKKQI